MMIFGSDPPPPPEWPLGPLLVTFWTIGKLIENNDRFGERFDIILGASF